MLLKVFGTEKTFLTNTDNPAILMIKWFINYLIFSLVYDFLYLYVHQTQNIILLSSKHFYKTSIFTKTSLYIIFGCIILIWELYHNACNISLMLEFQVLGFCFLCLSFLFSLPFSSLLLYFYLISILIVFSGC